MPAFGSVVLQGEPLTDEDIHSLAKYVQSFLAPEQYLLQSCIKGNFTFDTGVMGNYTVEVSNKEFLKIFRRGRHITISSQDSHKMYVYMISNRTKFIRTYLKIIQDNKVTLLMTVRFNAICKKPILRKIF